MIITRQKYLDMLVAGQGNGLVKIVTGGRGQEIRIWPLSFSEYYGAVGGER